MKGPYLRLRHDLRRLWECPACGRHTRAGGDVTFQICTCQNEVKPTRQVCMRLVEDSTRRELQMPPAPDFRPTKTDDTSRGPSDGKGRRKKPRGRSEGDAASRRDPSTDRGQKRAAPERSQSDSGKKTSTPPIAGESAADVSKVAPGSEAPEENQSGVSVTPPPENASVESATVASDREKSDSVESDPVKSAPQHAGSPAPPPASSKDSPTPPEPKEVASSALEVAPPPEAPTTTETPPKAQPAPPQATFAQDLTVSSAESLGQDVGPSAPGESSVGEKASSDGESQDSKKSKRRRRGRRRGKKKPGGDSK